MSRRRRSVRNIPYDPKNPPVISNLSHIVHQCLTTQGFDDRLVAEITSLVCLFRMPAAQYKYNKTDHEQLTWCRAKLEERSFSATFGPKDIFTVFHANKDGEIQIHTDKPLAKELLDVQDNGVEIFLRGQKRQSSKRSSGEDVKNHSHLFELRSFYKRDVKSTSTSSKCLNCFVVHGHIVFVDEQNDTYVGNHGDYDESCCVEFHAASLTDDLISMLNDGLANLMNQVSENSEDLPKGRLLNLLEKHIDEERWNLECIFDLKQSYSCDEEDDSDY